MQSEDVRDGKTTFVDMAYKYLLNGILSHQIKPGQALRSKELAEIVKISPTPIDRALERLTGEGLVEFRPGKGPYVPEPSVSEILDLYDVRLMLEVYTVQEGIGQVDSQFISGLEELLEKHEAACAALDGTYERHRVWIEADRDVHTQYVSLWPNPKAQNWYRQIDVHIKSFLLTSAARFYREGSMKEHRAIYQALSRRDLPAVVQAVREHSTISREAFLARARAAGFV
jgi:DNA-binding GntR family transcriptional regulator